MQLFGINWYKPLNYHVVRNYSRTQRIVMLVQTETHRGRMAEIVLGGSGCTSYHSRHYIAFRPGPLCPSYNGDNEPGALSLAAVKSRGTVQSRVIVTLTVTVTVTVTVCPPLSSTVSYCIHRIHPLRPISILLLPSSLIYNFTTCSTCSGSLVCPDGSIKIYAGPRAS